MSIVGIFVKILFWVLSIMCEGATSAKNVYEGCHINIVNAPFAYLLILLKARA